MRYQIFNSHESSARPVFSAPWRWLASSLSTLLSLNWKYFRLVDSLKGETLVEWAQATGPVVLGQNATIACVKQTPDGHAHTLYFGTTAYAAGCEPPGGHRPVTIIEAEGQNESASQDLGFTPKHHRLITQGVYSGCWTTSDGDGQSPVLLLGQRGIKAGHLINEAILVDERRKIEAAGGRVI